MAEPDARAEGLVDLLDSVIERYGRAAATDPVALAGALRAVTDPPPDRVVDTLAAVVASGAVDRLRAALDRDADAAAALGEALGPDAGTVDGVDGSAARWGLTVLGAALGLLPRAWAERPAPSSVVEPPAPDRTAPLQPTADPAPADAVPTAESPADGEPIEAEPALAEPVAPRRRAVTIALVVVVLLVAAVGGYALLDADPAGPEPAAAALVPSPIVPSTDPGTTAPVPEPTGEPAAPADPRAAFGDPAMLALAEPYLILPGATCAADEPDINVQEVVNCDFGNGFVAIFTRYLSVEFMVQIRDGFRDGHQAMPGTIARSLHWKYVAGQPGAKTGIRAGSPEQGEGVRIRFVHEGGLPLLYFDQGSSATAVMMSGGDAVDLDRLRAFWARPAG